MHLYITQTRFAVNGLIGLVTRDQSRHNKYKAQLADADKDYRHFRALLYTDVSSSGFGENVIPYFEKKKRDNKKKVEKFARKIKKLEKSIQVKELSINALSGTILQIAKQGISSVYGGLKNCPNGRPIGRETLKNVIWQARNQSMHYEEGSFNCHVEKCFANLAADYGDEFSLNIHARENLASKVVIDLLGWDKYSIYEADIKELLEGAGQL